MNLLAEKYASDIFKIYTDPWAEQKAKISHFYKTCFADKKWKNPDLEHVSFPEKEGNFKRPEFIFSQMTEQEAFDAYRNYFGKEKVWKAWDDITKSIDRNFLQKRPVKNYVILHVGGDEPDLLGYNYDDGIEKNIIFMTPLEGIISAFRHHFETENMYDTKGHTMFSALSLRLGVMHMYRNNGNSRKSFCVGYNYRTERGQSDGLRQVKLNK